jgi:hypothetical protein
LLTGKLGIIALRHRQQAGKETSVIETFFVQPKVLTRMRSGPRQGDVFLPLESSFSSKDIAGTAFVGIFAPQTHLADGFPTIACRLVTRIHQRLMAISRPSVV